MKMLKAWRYPGSWSVFRFDDRLLMILIAVIVGLSSGLAAVVLNRSLIFLLHWLQPWRQIWWAFCLPAIGAALSALFLDKIVKEGAGHGVPEVIYSVSRYGGLMRLRSSYSRLLSSCLTIASGGSAGPEAPVVMSGAAISSNIAKFFSLNDRQRVVLVGCGAAGAIAAIFNAPIAGMIFAMEVILGEWSATNLIPIAIAAVAGTEISNILQGNQIAFTHRQFNIDLLDTIACVGLAVITAIASIALTRAIRYMHHRFDHIKLPIWLHAAIGGCLVGVIGLFLPVVLGEGYYAIRSMIDGSFQTGLVIVAVALLVKIMATALTLGSGGSGGIFAPSLVIGSFAGLTYHRALQWLWPSVGWVNEGCYALLGMAGMVSAMLQAPLTGIFLIVEITGGYEVMLPLIIVSAISTTLCHYIEPTSFYLRDLVEKGQLLRPGTDARVLSDLNIRELIEKDCITIKRTMLLADFIDIIRKSRRNYFPVEDEQSGAFLGLIHMDDVRPFLFNPSMYHVVVMEQIMQTGVAVVEPDDDLEDVLRQMDEKGLFSMPVVTNNRFVGMISKATILDQYRKELMVQTCI